MFNKLSFEDFHQLSLAHKRVALFQDFSADLLTPMGAVQSLKKEFQSVVLLESGEQEALVGRYSHIGFDPICEIRANGFEIHVKSSEVDITHSKSLIKRIPETVVKVAESGIYRAEDTHTLLGYGFDALLIGEALVRSGDPKKLIGEICDFN